jgi:hypothetical protein
MMTHIEIMKHMKKKVNPSHTLLKCPGYFMLFVFILLVFFPFTICVAFDNYSALPDSLNRPYSRVIDPEFDDVYYRALWQDEDNNLWVGFLDTQTGEFTDRQTAIVSDGSLAEIDKVNANGPEWIFAQNYGTGYPSIVYVATDPVFRYRLKIARQIADPINPETPWLIYTPAKSAARFCPLGTYSDNVGPKRILYYKLTGNGPELYWRNLNNPYGDETLLNVGRGQAHFSFDGGKIALTHACCDIDQSCVGNEPRNPVLYDIDSGDKECIRETIYTAGFPWRFQDQYLVQETMMYTLEYGYRVIAVDRKEMDAWQRIKTIQAQPEPDGEPYISSPEPFKAASGKWYVVYATLSVPSNQFYADPYATGSIWVAPLTDDAPPWKITPDTPTRRSEPEALTLPTGRTIIYYTLSDENGLGQVFIADTGLQGAE